jgi:hypothetical protein
MSYNNADNYPLPFNFNDGDTGMNYAKPKYPKGYHDNHPIASLNVGESYCYEGQDQREFNHILMRMRKIGKVFKNDRLSQTYTRVE